MMNNNFNNSTQDIARKLSRELIKDVCVNNITINTNRKDTIKKQIWIGNYCITIKIK